MAIAKTVVGLEALVLLGLGMVGFVSPQTVMGMTGIEAHNAVAISEARVIFGALHFIIGGFFAGVALGVTRTSVEQALGLLVLLFGGMGIGRAVVVLIDDSWSLFHGGGLVFDFFLAALAMWARQWVVGSVRTGSDG
jgi:hypothetical protein